MPAFAPNVTIENLFDVLKETQEHGDIIDSQGRYHHWDDFRRRFKSNTLSLEQAWILTRGARLLRAVPTGFRDKTTISFTITEFGGLRHQLHLIDRRASGSLASPIKKFEHQDGRQHLVRSLIEEPFSSSILEGAATTRERAVEMIEKGDDPRSEGDQMVLNNHLAMSFIREHLEEDLTIEFVHDIHRIITKDTLADSKMMGRFREPCHDINVVNESTGEILHTPPHENTLEKRLQRICDFANEDYTKADPFFNPVVRGILLHFMLAYDHPYVDGNGRTARALFYWYVLKQGYWLLEYISISKLLREAPMKYGKAFLYSETDNGDITYFIIHQLDVILKALDALDGYLEQKSNERNELQNRLEALRNNRRLNIRQVAIVEQTIRNPHSRLTIKEHGQRSGVTYLTARKDLDDLVAENFLTRSNGKPIIYQPTNKILKLEI
ncbi:MAG: Fic family protein [Pseudomonadota bacterium]